MRSAEDSFTGEGGLEIFYRRWLPEGEPRCAVVISHGGGEHSGRYEHVAAALTAAGYGVWALDHRGHGHSEGPRMRFSSLDPLAADLRTLIGIAAEAVPGHRPFLLAHSVGSAIALHYACDHQDEIAGLIISGALASTDQAPSRVFAINLAARIAPGLGVFSVDPETVSRDPEVVSAYEADPLNFHGAMPAATIAALFRAGKTFPERLPSLTLPLLIMHGGADRLTPPSGSVAVDELASSEDKTLRIYDGLRHEILNEPEQDEIIAAIVSWIEERTTS